MLIGLTDRVKQHECEVGLREPLLLYKNISDNWKLIELTENMGREKEREWKIRAIRLRVAPVYQFSQ